MVEGLIGIKVGMTQVFEEDGKVVPVTILQAGPCIVVQKKDAGKDGYQAVQLGLVEARRVKNVNKPLAGHFKKADIPPTKVLREVKVDAEDEDLKVGDQLLVSQVFSVSDKVHVVGISKGHGFAGVVKRHHFRGGDATHGSMFHRAPGSIGASSYPSRVFKGMRMAGRMGNDRVTVKNLSVVRINQEKNLIAVRGAVPGKPGGYVLIKRRS